MLSNNIYFLSLPNIAVAWGGGICLHVAGGAPVGKMCSTVPETGGGGSHSPPQPIQCYWWLAGSQLVSLSGLGRDLMRSFLGSRLAMRTLQMNVEEREGADPQK